MKFIYILYQWLIAWPVFFVITLLTALVTIIMTCFTGTHFWGYYPAHIWSKMVCAIMLVRVRVVGRENIDPDTSYIFVANHQGAFDIWTIYGFLNHNFKWLMKKSLEKIFLVGYACKRSGHVMVDDSSRRGIQETIQNSESILKGGMSLVIFPEGSRSWDGKMGPFKRGAFMLASEFRLPVVPMTIDGSFKAMPRFTYRVTPCTITLTIHQPIYPGENGFNTRQLMSECREAIESSLPDSDKGMTSRPE